LDLDGLGDTALLILTILAGQEFTSRVKLGGEVERCQPLIELLAKLGLEIQQETESAFVMGGSEAKGHVFEEVDIAAECKLGVMVAALYAEGRTAMRESLGNRNRMERFLRRREVEVERRKDGEGYLVSVEGGQVVKPLDVEVAGQLSLTYPLIGAALTHKGSKLTIKRVAIHAGQRAFLDLLRQIGAEIDIEDLGEGEHDLHVRPSELKSTRVAGERAAKVIDQIALLAVLATQAAGEIVIRDIEHLRQGPFDYMGHLFESLRSLEARIGEFPEGIVVKGGFPITGGRLDGKGHPGLVMAFAVAGLLAEGELTIEGTECLEALWPDFFKTLHLLKENRR
jgi:3-phosphoshikimate 1-carboxyvinyltransferase